MDSIFIFIRDISREGCWLHSDCYFGIDQGTELIQKSSLVMGGLLTGMIILYQRFILFCNYDIIGIAKIYGFFHKKSGLKEISGQ